MQIKDASLVCGSNPIVAQFAGYLKCIGKNKCHKQSYFAILNKDCDKIARYLMLNKKLPNFKCVRVRLRSLGFVANTNSLLVTI